MDYFTIVEDTKAIIVSKGRYQQVDVYRRGTNVYVRTGGSFVRCLASTRNLGAEHPRRGYGPAHQHRAGRAAPAVEGVANH